MRTKKREWHELPDTLNIQDRLKDAWVLILSMKNGAGQEFRAYSSQSRRCPYTVKILSMKLTVVMWRKVPNPKSCIKGISNKVEKNLFEPKNLVLREKILKVFVQCTHETELIIHTFPAGESEK